MMQIYVKDLTGKNITIECEKTDSVQSIKEKIYEMERISVDQQRLIFKGKQLEDTMTLSDYEVTEFSVLNMVLRLKGGSDIQE